MNLPSIFNIWTDDYVTQVKVPFTFKFIIYDYFMMSFNGKLLDLIALTTWFVFHLFHVLIFFPKDIYR